MRLNIVSMPQKQGDPTGLKSDQNVVSRAQFDEKIRYSIDFERKTLLYDHLSIAHPDVSRLAAEC
jgi:hypothetical protein